MEQEHGTDTSTTRSSSPATGPRRWLSVFIGAIPSGVAGWLMLALIMPTTTQNAVAGSAPSPNPPQSVASSSTSACEIPGVLSSPCIAAGLKATDAARARERIGAMHLPAGFSSLAPAEQLFVLTNMERVARGLPPYVGLVDSLDQAASHAALADTDPTLGSVVDGLGVVEYGSNWAEDVNTIAANYDLMYNDGPGGVNLDCEAGNMTGCWGHRDNILWKVGIAQFPRCALVMGAAQAPDGPMISDTEVFALVSGTPTYVYTWAQAQAAGAGNELVPRATDQRTRSLF